MANIELPKDAEGREIPLDTEVLYFKDGSEHKVDKWVLYPHEGIRWAVVFDNEVRRDPDVLHLTPPDSWKKLLDDLDNAAEKASNNYVNEPCCAWFNDGGGGCTGCPADESPDDSCPVQLVKNIAARIRKLAEKDGE